VGGVHRQRRGGCTEDKKGEKKGRHKIQGTVKSRSSSGSWAKKSEDQGREGKSKTSQVKKGGRTRKAVYCCGG